VHGWFGSKSIAALSAMKGENWQLVTDEPVEFEKKPVEVREFKRVIDHFK
jgi:hypothetical protein